MIKCLSLTILSNLRSALVLVLFNNLNHNYSNNLNRDNLNRDNLNSDNLNSDNNISLVSRFLQTLCQLPEDKYIIVIVTNNYKEAVRDLWTKVLKCPWDRVHPNSAFRGATLNKLALINYFNQHFTGSKILYFDDDRVNYLGQKVDSNITIIDCFNKCIAEQLKSAGLNNTDFTVEKVEQIIKKLYETSKFHSTF